MELCYVTPMRWFFALAGALLLMTHLGCEHPSEEDCQRICWKGAKLAYEKQVADDVAKAPDEAARQAIREAGVKGWQEIKDMPTNPELMRCVLSCQKDGRPKHVECIDKAKTSKAVKDCM